MKLNRNQFTTKTLLEKLENEFGKKLSGEPFSGNDVMQYILRGRVPYRYGGWKISAKKINGVRIITLHGK